MAGRSTKECVRIAWECGFHWAADGATTDPAIPPGRDVVVMTLTEAQAEAALLLTPETWWTAWARGWVAGVADRNDEGGANAGAT